MPEDKKLDTKHPDFESMENKYQKWNDFYQGGELVEKKKEYLPRHPYETERQYQIRMDRATYRNHAAPIATVFSASVWDKEPERTLPDAMEDVVEDVDRSGMTANQFFKSVTDRAASMGIHFVIVDSPKNQAQTLAEQKQQGVRPYFVNVPAFNLIDWGFDARGELDYVVIYEQVEVEANPFAGHKFQDQYKLWRKGDWEIWVEQDDDDKKKAVMVDKGVNPLGKIPLATFVFERGGSHMTGVSCLDDVLSLCQRVYMRDSELDKALFDAAVEIACFFGFEEDELDAFIRSSSNGLRSANAEARVEYVAPTGRVFQALKENIADDERSIREIALRMVRPVTKQTESAESKRIDKQQLDSQLRKFAQNLEDGERRCWDLVAQWMNVSGDPEVVYNKDFDPEEISGDLAKQFIELRKNRDLSRETLWSILVDNGILRPDFDPQDEAAKIAAEGRVNPAFDRLRGGLGVEE